MSDKQQQIFDTVVNGLRKQNCQSINEEGECMYRGKNGTKCAAGQLILDEDYDQFFEGTCLVNRPCEDIGEMSEKANALYFLFTVKYKYNNDEIRLIKKLQDAHDNNDLGDWESSFSEIAYNYELRYECPQ